jgi:hypothetical protein
MEREGSVKDVSVNMCEGLLPHGERGRTGRRREGVKGEIERTGNELFEEVYFCLGDEDDVSPLPTEISYELQVVESNSVSLENDLSRPVTDFKAVTPLRLKA